MIEFDVTTIQWKQSITPSISNCYEMYNSEALKRRKLVFFDETIQICFKKALNSQNNKGIVRDLFLEEVQADINELLISKAYNVKEIMKIDQFLNPVEEKVADN